MNTYKRQSRKPKPQPANQCIDRFRREMRELGFEVSVDYGSGIYAPTVTVSLWPKREGKQA